MRPGLATRRRLWIQRTLPIGRGVDAMRGMLRVVTTAVTVILCVQAFPAWAVGFASITDPNDVAGKLDLAKLSLAKPAGNAPLTITVRTYDRWRKRVLRDDVNRL